MNFVGGFRGLWGHMGVLWDSGGIFPEPGGMCDLGASGALARDSLEGMNWMD